MGKILSNRAFRQVGDVVRVHKDLPPYFRGGNQHKHNTPDDGTSFETDTYNGPFAVTESLEEYGQVDILGGYLISGTEQVAVAGQSLELPMEEADELYTVYVFAEMYRINNWIVNLKASLIRPNQNDIEIGGNFYGVERHMLNAITITESDDSGQPNVMSELSQWWQLGDLRIFNRLVL